MGLDMYLSAKRYVSEYDDQDKPIIETINSIMPTKPAMRPRQVIFEAMYWRKANAIHGWFVDNVQDGQDDCKEYYVSVEQLRELVQTCLQVVEDRDPSAMPPTSGFFFGSSEADDWYYEDLTETAERLTKILSDENIKNFDFYYQSSW